jgi:hypothetical protein
MGKIGFLEGALIILGILWLLGIFRGFVIPVTIKTQRENPPPPPTVKPQKQVSPKYGDDQSEYVDYTEIKD